MKTRTKNISQIEENSLESSYYLKLKKRFQKSLQTKHLLKREKNVSIFLVDDDPLYIKALEISISGYLDDVAIKTFETGEACIKQMKKKPSIVILDYYLNSEFPNAWNGMSVLKQIKSESPKTKVIMLSSQDSLKVAIDCMENGAYDYISKSQTALLRVNNCIANIIDNEEQDSATLSFLKYATLIFLIIIIVYAILNR